MLHIFKKIKEWFRNKCPNCNHTLRYDFYDMQFDKNVYVCDNCKKLWM